MKILFISNFYPFPNADCRGGYELWCQEVCDGLRSRGHQVLVLTSRHGPSSRESDRQPHVHRELELELATETGKAWRQFLRGHQQRERHNLRCLLRALADFDPDTILIWGMWNLPASLAALAEQHRPVVYYVGDLWPTLPSEFHLYLQVPSHNPRRAPLKRLLSKVALLRLPPATKPVEVLRFDCVLCPSQYLCDLLAEAGIPRENLSLVPGAIDTTHFADRGPDEVVDRRDGKLSLLWVGRITPEKGVETAIQAVGRVQQRAPDGELTLTIVGRGQEHYLEQLKALVVQKEIGSRVTFLGPVKPDEMPSIYTAFDAFLFTSTLRAESFGRVLAEAMASGLPVISTMCTGGTREILDNGKCGLTFDGGDPDDLATQILRLVEDADLRRQLARSGQVWVREHFDIKRMVDQIEFFLYSSLSRGGD